MKSNSAKSNAITDSSRCAHSTSPGHRCRMLAAPDSRFCAHHWQHDRLDAATLAAELSQAAGSLESPEDVNRVLAKIFLALAEDRIPTRKAAVLGYLGQMLLRSHHEIAFQKKTEAAAPVQRILSIDIPSAAAERARERMRAQEIRSCDNPPPGPLPFAAPPDTPQSARHTSPPPTTSTNSSSPTASTPPPAPPLPKPFDYNHFYPWDPTLPPGMQDPRKNIPPPDEQELRRREYRHGFRQSCHTPRSNRWYSG